MERERTTYQLASTTHGVPAKTAARHNASSMRQKRGPKKRVIKKASQKTKKKRKGPRSLEDQEEETFFALL
jgi:hypothetical protein